MWTHNLVGLYHVCTCGFPICATRTFIFKVLTVQIKTRDAGWGRGPHVQTYNQDERDVTDNNTVPYLIFHYAHGKHSEGCNAAPSLFFACLCVCFCMCTTAFHLPLILSPLSLHPLSLHRHQKACDASAPVYGSWAQSTVSQHRRQTRSSERHQTTIFSQCFSTDCVNRSQYSEADRAPANTTEVSEKSDHKPGRRRLFTSL